MMINDNIDVHNGSNGTTAEFVKAYLKPGAKLVPIQMFGYWVYSVTVDEVDLCGNYDRFKGKFRDLTRCVQKVSSD
jgi:hypothetical protein